jgi:hypothetical protein
MLSMATRLSGRGFIQRVPSRRGRSDDPQNFLDESAGRFDGSSRIFLRRRHACQGVVVRDGLERIGAGHKATQVSWNRRVVPDQLGKFGLYASMCFERAVFSLVDERLCGMEGRKVRGPPGVFNQIRLQHPETSHQHVPSDVQKLRGF